MAFDEHPTVVALRARPPAPPPRSVSKAWLRTLAMDCGADDAGVVEATRPALADQHPYIRQVYPAAKTLLAILCRMNREPVRSPVRSVANEEFHGVYDHVNETARRIVTRLREEGIEACNAVAAFPMEAQSFPGRTWTVAHKPIAVEAGLGHMGLHRSVIHPRFGSFVLLGTVLIDAETDEHDHPIDYNPCLNCKLCVAACPVGALKPDGAFDFVTCYTHNYREFLGGFTDWVGHVADAKNGKDYHRRVTPGETVSMWQSLSFKPGYKAAYCIAVCPAGEDVINPFLEDRAEHVARVVKPLADKEETLYVLPGADAEKYAAERFPHKTVQRVRRTVTPQSVRAFLFGLTLSFQRGRSKGLAATYHWTFEGDEAVKATVVIAGGKLKVADGHEGEPDVRVTADSAIWLRVVARDYPILKAIILRKVRVKGDMDLFRAFGRCFP